jgi:ribosomal protein S18 acetylase RimI-like enzyme
MPDFQIREARPQDLPWIRSELQKHWHSTTIWSRGKPFRADQLPAFVAESQTREPLGLVTYRFEADECEVVTLSSTTESRGVGSLLLSAAVDAAKAKGCRRIFLTTTNDNLRAIGFYQKRGWRLCRLYAGVVDAARTRWPSIPLTGFHGIRVRDELELELPLDDRPRVRV